MFPWQSLKLNKIEGLLSSLSFTLFYVNIKFHILFQELLFANQNSWVTFCGSIFKMS